ncbi:MAG TPA: diaminopimelate epimerase [Alphaproteobacteria bacterium]|jgi:diaminopimelate epimerase|nr:diaminopimelate epimerase [Alphaproteobacteria bacterium]
MTIPFRKMHGLGNDFIVFDARHRPLALSPAQARALADRHTGIGADTIALLDPPNDGEADIAVRFINADGGEMTTCGNATRCIAKLLFSETGRDHVRIATGAGILDAWKQGELVAVDMGTPKLDWTQIPVAHEIDTLHLPLDADPVGVNMGNPHAVFFVPDAEAVDVAVLGSQVERDPLFPERTNVEFAAVQASDRIRMRVWERGVGITQACGSGACATLVAAARRGLTGRKATVALDGGDLTIEWRDDDHVVMTGPAALSFTGEIEDNLVTGSARRAEAA